MKKGQSIGACQALTMTKMLFWGGFGLMLLSMAIMSITE